MNTYVFYKEDDNMSEIHILNGNNVDELLNLNLHLKRNFAAKTWQEFAHNLNLNANTVNENITFNTNVIVKFTDNMNGKPVQGYNVYMNDSVFFVRKRTNNRMNLKWIFIHIENNQV